MRKHFIGSIKSMILEHISPDEVPASLRFSIVKVFYSKNERIEKINHNDPKGYD